MLDFYPAGADPTVANPVATLDLGKPAIVNGECAADISSAIVALPPRHVHRGGDRHGHWWQRAKCPVTAVLQMTKRP